MHYRNGREAKNGDKIVKLDGGNVVSFGVLHSAVPGNDFCNGNIAAIQPVNDYACMCDCLHIDDVAAICRKRGLISGLRVNSRQSHTRHMDFDSAEQGETKD